MAAKGILYVVATPIGNMEDITLRAIRVLKEADLIAAEDTRHTKKLLSRYGIGTRLTSYHEHNERKKAPRLVERLKEGARVALVTDAGTPGISDPGYRLIRLAADNHIPVTAVPGPSSIMAVLSVSGLPIEEFTFKGFVPSSQTKRKRFFVDISEREGTYIVFEAARRLKETLLCMLDILGDVEMVLAREMTKLHEEVLRGRASEILALLEKREIKGEVTIVFRTFKREPSRGGLSKDIERMLKEGASIKDVVSMLSAAYDISKKELYREALRVKEEME